MTVDINDHHDNKASIKVLDKGYVRYIEHMGSDESFVEAARMSTGKGFLGWYWEEDTYSDCYCSQCETHHLKESLPTTEDEEEYLPDLLCTTCWSVGTIVTPRSDDQNWKPKLLGTKGEKRDLGLLGYLYSNRHSTPFEMGDLIIEVKAPIEVFRQWHRHRTQSYNEFSARYSQMPNEHYVPELERFRKQSKSNKQGSSDTIPKKEAELYRAVIHGQQQDIYVGYEGLLKAGIAKEVARINTPVSRYSKMRAKANIRNWLGFLALRMDLHAQWEIREYANAVASIVKTLFPRTFDLFLEWDLLGQNFSRTEMNFLYHTFIKVLGDADSQKMLSGRAHTYGMDQKQFKALLAKLTNRKDDLYKEVLEKL